ncbi:sigma-54-dependent Fis family transcriptional regulator [Carboxydocella sp. JDF658]|uniref:sigma-54 interaction domain-containing protein n=1 Tax=Carboxydocella sp. JDF658 TaxID=1926600 RepID=UPI0009AE3C73|nr:sigma 54-interacting transcriptional regulator [Carboxydocella sp. JDF658]GAW31608.1 Fis family transcriptional regulator [Carboxydocella sp. JDF658]
MAILRFRIVYQDRVGILSDIARELSLQQVNIITLELSPNVMFMEAELPTGLDFSRINLLLHKVEGVKDVELIERMPHQEREWHLQALLDSISDGILAIDQESKIVTINPVAETIFRIKRQEALGRPVAEILSPDIPMLKCLQDGQPYSHKEMILNTRRGRLHFLTTGRPIKDEKGRVIGVVASIKDMSEVRQLVYSVTQPPMTTFADILKTSPSLRPLIDLAQTVARGNSTILIRGESGTGKELLARAIHMASRRRGKPFVPINCAALPDSLLEAELFGYGEGAFTGAKKGGKQGLFEFAHQGTLFLDEIGELSPHLQAKLLRVLQEGRVRRIGEQEEIPVDVRIICATHRNLEEMIGNGRFREDLYYRLNVVPLYLPPLRERKEDIPGLVKSFIEKFNQRLDKNVQGIEPQALKRLESYDWPGNIRELENVIERAMNLAAGPRLQEQHILLERNQEVRSTLPRNNFGEMRTLAEIVAEVEKEVIRQALSRYKSGRQAAKALGLSHTALQNKIKKYQLADGN